MKLWPGNLWPLAAALATVVSAGGQEVSPWQDYETNARVGRVGAKNLITPVNQLVTPAGRLVELPGMRPQALALSPNGRLLVTAGKTHDLVVLDPASGVIRQRVPLPSDAALAVPEEAVSQHILEPDKEGMLSFTGLVFSPDGRRIYLANSGGTIKVFGVVAGDQVKGLFSLPLPLANAPERKLEIPSGLALSPDGRRLYVCGNLSNRLLELDATTGALLRAWDVGVAPFDVVLAGDKAYVSNWGGRRPASGSFTGPAGRGTFVRVDPVRHIASEGSVSVISLRSNLVVAEVLAGLHASALAVTPNRRYLVVANSGSDTLSVLDTRTDTVVETFSARPNPADLFGAQPDALAFDRSGQRLFVCEGTQNAVGVFEFEPGRSKLLGLIPVGWFPGAILCDARRDSLYVANLKHLGPGRPRKSNGQTEFNTHQYYGSLSLVPIPSARQLAAHTAVALRNLRYPLLKQAALPARSHQPACPVPERVGEPSVFQHVVYIIKENRTYDQVLGDMPQGNGDPGLCIFGEEFTPNQHQIARDFVLLDNTYCSGILSADGHQWADSGLVNEYLERSFAGFPRSYPDGMGDEEVDALAYSSAGFIWDKAVAHGRSLRVYGEFAITRKHWADPARKGRIKFLDHWRDYTNRTAEITLYSEPAIASLHGFLCTKTVGWDMAVPDVWRAERFLEELREFERTGELPRLIILCLPNDHTSGTTAGKPTPGAHVADNDLAVGRVIEALSRSRFWKDTCIFAIEDDPQNGWDHVSGYRTTAYVVSPYTKRGVTISTQYNQTSLLRTMELILGLSPMNQLDATATPMFDCFTPTPDFTPFTALPNRVPLDQLNPAAKDHADASARRDALVSAKLPLDQVDACPEDVLNQILWRAMKGPSVPYPAWAVRAVEDDD